LQPNSFDKNPLSNPNTADSLDGLKGFISYLTKNKIECGYTTLHKVIAEGNFMSIIYTYFEGTL
jgi:hypothetical protein